MVYADAGTRLGLEQQSQMCKPRSRLSTWVAGHRCKTGGDPIGLGSFSLLSFTTII